MSVPHEIEHTLSFALKRDGLFGTDEDGAVGSLYATQYRVEQYGEYDLITMADDSRFAGAGECSGTGTCAGGCGCVKTAAGSHVSGILIGDGYDP